MISITIWEQPITKKNHSQIIKARGHYMVIPSKQYRDYEKACGTYLDGLLEEPIDRPVEVKCLYYMQTHRRCDLKDLPEPYELCQLIGYGSDFIVAKEGENFEQTLTRIQQEEWHRVGYIDDEGFWDGDEGYPMMVSPRYWKKLDWSRDE